MFRHFTRHSHLSDPLKCVTTPSPRHVYLGRTGLRFFEVDPATAESQARDSRIAARRGLRQYIAGHLQTHPELLLRFAETGMTFEYQIEASAPLDDGAIVTLSVWLETAVIDWDPVALSA